MRVTRNTQRSLSQKITEPSNQKVKSETYIRIKKIANLNLVSGFIEVI